jgi:CAAX prenyl protease-like protein
MTPQRQRASPDPTPSAADDEGGWLGRPATARILPFALYLAFIAIADLCERLGWSAEALRWLYPAKIAAVTVALLAYRRHYSELAWRGLHGCKAVTAGAVGVLVLVLWIGLDASWMHVGQAAGFDPTGPDGRINWLLVGVRIAGAALVVPVMEELFWRSFLLRWLERQNFLNVYPAGVGMKSFIVTVILFGVEHNQWLAGMAAGVAYNLLYMRTGNLWTAVLAHAVTNGLLGVWVVSTASWSYW